MTPAQQTALRRAVEADAPVKITASTAAVLAEQYRYITPCDGGWIPTDNGRAAIANTDYDHAYRQRCSEIPRASREYAKRVMCWLACHGYVGGMDRYGQYYAAQQYAEHYAACIHAGLEPIRPDGDTTRIEFDVQMAINLLRDFDEAQEKSAARGDVCIEVAYTVAPSHPKAKADSVVVRADGAVDLRQYRLSRPGKPTGAA